MRILVIDNYDSFVFNLVQYLGQLGAECEVRRNDEITRGRRRPLRRRRRAALTRPGYARAGRHLHGRDHASTRASCRSSASASGHQAFGAAFGAHRHPGPGAAARQDLAGAPQGRRACWPGCPTRSPRPATTRSPWCPSTLPDEIEVTGRTESGVVMAMRHRTLPIEGVQFHPESVLTEGGHLMLANWLAACGLPEALERAPELAAEVEARRRAAFAA